MKFWLMLMIISLLETIHSVGICNLPLMRRFFLQGSKYSHYQAMKLCPQIKDKCCTIVDEIRIQKFWNLRAEPFLGQYYDQVILTTSSLMDLFDKIIKIDPRHMNIKFLTNKMVPYDHEYCTNKVEPYDKDKIALFNDTLDLFRMEEVRKEVKAFSKTGDVEFMNKIIQDQKDIISYQRDQTLNQFLPTKNPYFWKRQYK